MEITEKQKEVIDQINKLIEEHNLVLCVETKNTIIVTPRNPETQVTKEKIIDIE